MEKKCCESCIGTGGTDGPEFLCKNKWCACHTPPDTTLREDFAKVWNIHRHDFDRNLGLLKTTNWWLKKIEEREVTFKSNLIKQIGELIKINDGLHTDGIETAGEQDARLLGYNSGLSEASNIIKSYQI